jgi:hypothetical protein
MATYMSGKEAGAYLKISLAILHEWTKPGEFITANPASKFLTKSIPGFYQEQELHY